MATTEPLVPFSTRPHHLVTTAALGTLFWAVAAMLVLATHRVIEPWSARGGALAAVAALVLAAFAYTRLVAREAGVAHALAVGIGWLVLSIVAEMALTASSAHPWFTLLGSPQRPLLRLVFMFAWVFSPSLFARRDPAVAERQRREERYRL